MSAGRSVLIALGGNAIHGAGSGTIDEQFAVTRRTMEPVSELIAAGSRVLLTHGNGPIVGNIMIRNEAVRDVIPPMPLYICGADSQGGIGLMLQQVLRNALVRRGIEADVVTIVTQVLVDGSDPAFSSPAKPIGPFYGEHEAEHLAEAHGWVVREDAGRGLRRFVPSPSPREVVELPTIRALLESGRVVIAAGGGGVPVLRRSDGDLEGVDAVVDKDRVAAFMAERLGFDTLVFVTSVDHVFIDFGTGAARALERVGVAELAGHHDAGQFSAGSMGPKVEAAIGFLRSGGGEAIITSPDDLAGALAGRSGTHVVRD